MNSLAGMTCYMHSRCVPTVLSTPVMGTVADRTSLQTVVAVATNRPVDCTAPHGTLPAACAGGALPGWLPA